MRRTTFEAVKRVVRVTTFPVILVLSGCTTFNVSSHYTLNDETNEGLVVVSLSYEGLEKSVSPSCEYRDIKSDGARLGYVTAHNLREGLDWSLPLGRLSYFALPSGRYEFFHCSFARQTGSGVPYWTTGPVGVATNADPLYAGFNLPTYKLFEAERFSAPFEILPGKTTYVGNLHLVWIEATQSGEVKILDRRQRDFALLHERFPNL